METRRSPNTGTDQFFPLRGELKIECSSDLVCVAFRCDTRSIITYSFVLGSDYVTKIRDLSLSLSLYLFFGLTLKQYSIELACYRYNGSRPITRMLEYRLE